MVTVCERKFQIHMKTLNKSNIFKYLVFSVCIFILLFSIFTIAKASSYSVLIEDDYWHGNDVGGGSCRILELFYYFIKICKKYVP